MSEVFEILDELSKIDLLSGREISSFERKIPELFAEFGASLDEFGNLWIKKGSDNPNARNILIEAHLDAIGLCVKEICDGGFVSVCSCGGFDFSILPSTEFIIHSEKAYQAVATSVPPHLLKKTDNGEITNSENVYLDCGFSSKAEAEKHIKPGSSVSFAAPCKKLLNGCIASPSLDNKAAVTALLLTSAKVRSHHNLLFMFSMGEETTSRGVKSAKFEQKPELAFVVDAGFGYAKGLDEDKCIKMHHGPSISIADTLSRSVPQWVIRVAEREKLPLQIVVEPGGTGTSATALQLRENGIPCGLISIPLKYMHTPSEVVSIGDVEKTAELLCTLLEQEHIPFGEVNLIG